MKEYTENQKEIIDKVNEIMTMVEDQQDWLDIAYNIAISELDNAEPKLEKILNAQKLKTKNLLTMLMIFYVI